MLQFNDVLDVHACTLVYGLLVLINRVWFYYNVIIIEFLTIDTCYYEHQEAFEMCAYYPEFVY